MPVIKYRRPALFPAATPLTGFAGLEEISNRMRNLLDDFVGATPVTETISFMPPTEIVETPTELRLTAELPGMTLKDVTVNVEDGILYVRGEKTEERKEEEKEKKYLLWERSYGSFQRAFSLPPTVDSEKISAKFQNGILHVTMPKSAEAKSKGHKVEITE